jgi:hypothetical protein
MWHEVALTGMVAIRLISKVDTPASLRRSGRPIFGAGPSRHRFAANGNGRCNGELSLDELRGALAQALAKRRPRRVLVTVRVHTVILGPSSGGQGPANASPDQIIGEVIIQHGSAKLIATFRARCEEHSFRWVRHSDKSARRKSNSRSRIVHAAGPLKLTLGRAGVKTRLRPIDESSPSWPVRG